MVGGFGTVACDQTPYKMLQCVYRLNPDIGSAFFLARVCAASCLHKMDICSGDPLLLYK